MVDFGAPQRYHLPLDHGGWQMDDDSIDLPAHDDLADLFLALGALQTPAELHGYLTGQLAVGERLAEADWVRQVQEFLDCEAPDPEQRELLMRLYRATLAELESGQMALTLLLPDEVFELDQRVESLGHWCQGFLAGFAMAGKRLQSDQGPRNYSDDIAEALNDLASIAQVGIEEEDEQGEESESQLFAVCEYVRMAALTVYLECHMPEADSASGNPAGSRKLH